MSAEPISSPGYRAVATNFQFVAGFSKALPAPRLRRWLPPHCCNVDCSTQAS